MFGSVIDSKPRKHARTGGKAPSYAHPWLSDQHDGTYRNPVLYADYPDPDVIRCGDDYFMVVSSFHVTPGLPILHSRDLVNWSIINHALESLPPRYDAPQPGCGVWAPAIRKHAGKFFIFYSMPDEGIYCTHAVHPEAKWSAPHLVHAGKGLIDPCPLWDDDGQAYLVHAYAGSRAGIKHKLRVRPMAPDCSRLLGKGQIVFDQPEIDPTTEGPKFFKRNGYYYIFAPAGGVEDGWQLALRSRHVYGPYERKVILEQGSTSINGPHQGALVDRADGAWWFLHFQDVKPYGRLLHLQPAAWRHDWPVVGKDHDGNGIGEPMERFALPAETASAQAGDPPPAALSPNRPHMVAVPATSDHFLSSEPGLQWHWNGNHKRHWFSLTERPGWMRLYAQPVPTPGDGPQPNMAACPAILMQKFPARSFVVETQVALGLGENEHAGLVVMGRSWAALDLEPQDESHVQLSCLVDGVSRFSARLPRGQMILRIHVADGGHCAFSYETLAGDGGALPVQFVAAEGIWVGAKVGIYSASTALCDAGRTPCQNRGFADFDYLQFRAPHGD